MIYNTVLVTGVQSGSSIYLSIYLSIYIHIAFSGYFPLQVTMDTEHCSLCYTVNPVAF